MGCVREGARRGDVASRGALRRHPSADATSAGAADAAALREDASAPSSSPPRPADRACCGTPPPPRFFGVPKSGSGAAREPFHRNPPLPLAPENRRRHAPAARRGRFGGWANRTTPLSSRRPVGMLTPPTGRSDGRCAVGRRRRRCGRGSAKIGWTSASAWVPARGGGATGPRSGRRP